VLKRSSRFLIFNSSNGLNAIDPSSNAWRGLPPPPDLSVRKCPLRFSAFSGYHIIFFSKYRL
jgi:hypothetical protein